MSEEDRRRWNAKYEKVGPAGEPHPFLREQARSLHESLGEGARALDVACGRGRNALHLARLGFQVLAVDVSDLAVAGLRRAAEQEGLELEALRRDVTDEGLPEGPFGLVVVTAFLERDLFDGLASLLAPGGFLLYSTFTTARTEHTGGRFRREYCLELGELEGCFPGLEVVTLKEHQDEREEEASAVFVRAS